MFTYAQVGWTAAWVGGVGSSMGGRVAGQVGGGHGGSVRQPHPLNRVLKRGSRPRASFLGGGDGRLPARPLPPSPPFVPTRPPLLRWRPLPPPLRAQARQLPALAPFLPTHSPRLQPATYDLVLNAFLHSPAGEEALAGWWVRLHAWPKPPVLGTSPPARRPACPRRRSPARLPAWLGLLARALLCAPVPTAPPSPAPPPRLSTHHHHHICLQTTHCCWTPLPSPTTPPTPPPTPHPTPCLQTTPGCWTLCAAGPRRSTPCQRCRRRWRHACARLAATAPRCCRPPRCCTRW